MSSKSGPSSLEMCVRSLRGLDGVVRDVAVRVSWPLANCARGHLCSQIGVCLVGSHQDQTSTERLSQGVSRLGPWSSSALPCPAASLSGAQVGTRGACGSG